MHVLFVDEASQSQSTTSELEVMLIAQEGPIMITQFKSMQTAIEFLEQTRQVVDVVVIGYDGSSTIMLKAMLSAIRNSLFVLVTNEKVNNDVIVKSGKMVSTMKRVLAATQLPEIIKRLVTEKDGRQAARTDSDFIALPADGIAWDGFLPADLFVRLGEDKYCRIFKRGSELVEPDMQMLVAQRRVKVLYTPKATFNPTLFDQQKRLETLPEATKQNREQIRETIVETVDVIHDVVTKSGFTLESQILAKKVVDVTIKMIGSKPDLADIMKRIRNNEGLYISSHSTMLAELCCALAFRIGWSSSSTFLKLTLAAFLHDLCITDQKLAKMQSVSQAEGAFAAAEVQQFRFHPMRAAEYVQAFTDIPPDVDTIVLQHHERPDGKGFPRGLFGHQISPLATIFIISQDLLNMTLEKGPTQILDFVKAKSDDYSTGAFRKIVKALQTNQKIGN